MNYNGDGRELTLEEKSDWIIKVKEVKCVLGEHRTVGVDVGGSLGKVPCSEELARQIHVLGGSMIIWWATRFDPVLHLKDL